MEKLYSKLEDLEDTLMEDFSYDSTTLQNELDIVDYSWSLAIEDLENLGVDTDSLDMETYFGLDLESMEEITVEEYVEKLEVLLKEERERK